jgi:hypothetical protein
MAQTSESLIDVVLRLGCLLERPDLTNYERQRYQADFLKLTQKCLTASDGREWQIALNAVHRSPQAQICRKSGSSLN